MNRGDDALKVAAQLVERGQPFVLATVVRALAPTSTKPGDKAVITGDGEVFGWVGGSCAEPIVKKEAAAALEDGACRLVHISPEAELPPSRDGLTFRPMTCYSGGLLEIHVEPHLARPLLLVCGNSPVAHAVAALGKALRYRVVVADLTTRPSMGADLDVVTELDELPTLGGANTFAVVASHGMFDLDALEKVLSLDTGYVGFVASERRRASVFDSLSARGISDEALARIDAPAGLDLGGKEPEEVALSILAQVVTRRNAAKVKVEEPAKASSCCASKKVEEPVPAPAEEESGGCCHGG